MLLHRWTSGLWWIDSMNAVSLRLVHTIVVTAVWPLSSRYARAEISVACDLENIYKRLLTAWNKTALAQIMCGLRLELENRHRLDAKDSKPGCLVCLGRLCHEVDFNGLVVARAALKNHCFSSIERDLKNTLSSLPMIKMGRHWKVSNVFVYWGQDTKDVHKQRCHLHYEKHYSFALLDCPAISSS